MKIICVGLNYLAHAREFGADLPAEPLLFGKFANALIRPGEAIVIPPESTHTDSEGELAIEIGCPARRVSEDDALEFVAGYRCANDLTARNLQQADGQWLRQSFDTFYPLGDRLVPVSERRESTGAGCSRTPSSGSPPSGAAPRLSGSPSC